MVVRLVMRLVMMIEKIVPRPNDEPAEVEEIFDHDDEVD